MTQTLRRLLHEEPSLQTCEASIRQHEDEYQLAQLHIKDLKNRFPNVISHDLDLSTVFSSFENVQSITDELFPKNSINFSNCEFDKIGLFRT